MTSTQKKCYRSPAAARAFNMHPALLHLRFKSSTFHDTKEHAFAIHGLLELPKKLLEHDSAPVMGIRNASCFVAPMLRIPQSLPRTCSKWNSTKPAATLHCQSLLSCFAHNSGKIDATAVEQKPSSQTADVHCISGQCALGRVAQTIVGLSIQ